MKYQSGFVTTREFNLPNITNNLTELLAALYALESVPDNWNGTIFTDSRITLFRVTNGVKFAGIPQGMIDRAMKLRRNRKYKCSLVGGHPTREELKKGFKRKNGLPVSQFNVFVDGQCKKAIKDFLGK